MEFFLVVLDKVTCYLNEIFYERIIDLFWPNNWMPRVPNLKSINFCVWADLKVRYTKERWTIEVH